MSSFASLALVAVCCMFVIPGVSLVRMDVVVEAVQIFFPRDLTPVFLLGS